MTHEIGLFNQYKVTFLSKVPSRHLDQHFGESAYACYGWIFVVIEFNYPKSVDPIKSYKITI